MSGSNGGVIGAAVVPTSTAASGVWRPSSIAARLNGAMRGQLWPTLADANFSSNTLCCNGQAFTTGGQLKDTSSSGNHMGVSLGGVAGPAFGVGKFQAFAFASASAANGGGLYVVTAAASSLLMGTGDFTLELWFYTTSIASTQVLIDLRTSDTSVVAPTLLINSSGKLLAYSNAAVGTLRITGGTTVSTNTWHHTHWTRASGASYLGLDGAQEGSDYSDSLNYNSHNSCFFGRAAPSALNAVQGYILPGRITKGLARYARSYTVPTAPFPDY